VLKLENLVEKVLISKLRQGSKDAFSVIFITYYKDLVLFATNYTHEIDTAQEIIQDTFLKLWEDHDEIDIKISLKSYLLKTVQNRCIDWLRHVKVQQKFKDESLINSIDYEFNADTYLINSEIEEIGQVFNVDIELQGSALQDYRYRATFEDESLAEILKLLEISSPISYNEIKRTPLPDGSFPKKKIIIFPVKHKR